MREAKMNLRQLFNLGGKLFNALLKADDLLVGIRIF